MDISGVDIHCIGIFLRSRRLIRGNVTWVRGVAIVMVLRAILESVGSFNPFKASMIIGELQTIRDEFVVIIKVTLSLKDHGVCKVFRESLDEVVAFVNIVSDLGMESELIEFCDVFGDGALSLVKVHELHHSSALNINRGEGCLEFSDEVIPGSISIRSLESDICIGSGIKSLGMVHKIFEPDGCSSFSHV